MPRPLLRALLASALLISLAAGPTRADEPYDLIIRGGRIVDGTGNAWFRGDLAIRGDKIAAVGLIPADAEARRTVDARGKVVAPGFIDMHSHSDFVLLEDGAALGKLCQGVTTEVLGEDSSGGPNRGKRPAQVVDVAGTKVEIATMADYLGALERGKIAVNVATYVGLGNVWGNVMGESFDRPTPEQLEAIGAEVAQAMEEGAYGLSTMMASPQALIATTDDLVALGKVVQKYGGLYSSHIRNEGTDVLAAVDEAIAVGERAGIPVDIIHIKIAEQTLWGRMPEIIAKIDAARARGVNVQANIYPYTRGNNNLASIIPPWAHEGGTQAMLVRLKSPSDRARMKRDITGGIAGWYNHYTAVGGDWSRMLISEKLSGPNKGYEGRTMDVILAERAKARGREVEPLDDLFDFLIEEDGSIGAIYAHHTESDMNLAMQQPWCSIGSDGSAYAIEGPLRRGHPHPRNFGSFPRVLGVYVRERKLLGLEDAVRKMTSLNAAKLGILDRGLLRPGLAADVTVFDPETVIDRSTYLEPFQYSEGISLVVVNGEVVLEDGKPTDARPGRALRRGR